MTTSVLVTGANAGLGLAASTELARLGRHVVLGCRNVERGEAAAAAIRREVPAASVELVQIDVSSLQSVRDAAKELLSGDRPPLDTVIGNAGLQIVSGVERSVDGYELTFATNHLGHYLLIRLLHPHMAEPGRIVLVSSETHQGPRRSFGFPGPEWAEPALLADPDRPGLDTSSRAGRVRYATSKLLNLYTVYEFARRASDRQVTINAFDPGLMPESGLSRDYPALMRRLYTAVAPLVAMLPGANTVAGSGRDLAWFATAPDVADVTGAYYSGRRRNDSSAESHDRERALRLWVASAEMVGLPD